MPATSTNHSALRLIVLLNVPCFLLVAVMMWVSHHKSAETAAFRAEYAPVDEKVRQLIETERDIDKLRKIARIENIGASGSMEALLHISKKSTTTLLPGAIIPLVSILVAGIALRKPRRPAASSS